MEHFSEQINEISAALAKAQGEIKPAVEDKINPHYKSSYSSLNSVWDACREPLSKNGLAITQIMTGSGDSLTLITTLSHSSGQWMRSYMPIISGKATPQALGSALSYMKRYSLAAMVGIASGEDDDANEAQGKPQAIVMAPQEEVKANGYADFCKRHQIDNPISEVGSYIDELVKKQGKPEISIINAAVKNEAGFLEVFEKWKAKKKEKELWAQTSAQMAALGDPNGMG